MVERDGGAGTKILTFPSSVVDMFSDRVVIARSTIAK